MNNFIAEVRNLKDPWESGRVQIRIYGAHDDEQNIKDEDLKWAMVAMPVTSASTNKIGTSPTGLLVGSRVIGYYLDEAEQIPIVTGSFHRAGKQKDEEDNTKGYDDIDDNYSDIPIAAKGSKKQTPKSNTQAKKTTEKKQYDPKQEPKYNKNDYVSDDDGEDALEASRKKNASKTQDLKTIGSTDKSQTGNSILDLILKTDQQNEAGALTQAPQLFNQILQISNISSMTGMAGMAGGSFGGMLSGLASMTGMGGIGNIIGQLSGMLGGMVGGGGGSGGGSSIGNIGGSGSSVSSTGGNYSIVGSTAPIYEILSKSNFTDAEFIKRLYQICFGKNPTAGEFNYWTKILANGTPRKNLLSSFLSGSEYTKQFSDNTAFVNSLYKNLLNRNPDPGGLDFFLQQLNRTEILPDFNKLTLAQATSSSVIIIYFLEAAYKIILERDPDDAGLKWWVESKLSKEDMIMAFFTSPEYLAKYSNPTVWTTKLYQKLLGRDPDPDGLKYCLSKINENPASTLVKQILVKNGLDSEEFKNLTKKPYATVVVSGNGMTRQQVIDTFLNSKEFSNDFLKYELSAADIALVAADLLNQLKGFTTPSDQIGGMTLQQREVLYNALLTLLNNTYIPVAQKMNMGQITSDTVHDADFLTRLYQLVLGRDPDIDGLNYWLIQLRKGLDRREVIYYFFSSKEYNAKHSEVNNFVTSLYEKILNREPDPTGLIYWTDLLITQTLSRQDVVRLFIYNDEFENLKLRKTRLVNLNTTTLADIMSQSVNNTDFVIRLYEIFLKREPDDDGLLYWVKQLEKGASRFDVVIAFACSDEYTGIYTPILDFVTSLYVNILNRKPATATTSKEFVSRTYVLLYNRDPNADELAYWSGLIDDGLSRYDFLTNFIDDANQEANNPQLYAITLANQLSSYNNTDFIDKVYQKLYVRNPTSAEKKLGLSQLNGGLTKSRFITNILDAINNSQSFNINNYSIDVNSVLFRMTVSFNEWDYWEDLLSEGELSRAQVVQAFLYSKEFQDLEFNSGNVIIDDSKISGLITNPPLVIELMNNATKVDATTLVVGQLMTSVVNNSDFIIRLYEILLGREFDVGGFSYWLTKMSEGMPKSEVLIDFLVSAEYTQKYPTDEQYITSLYVNLLNRKPDQGGIQYFLNQMKNEGRSRALVALEFIDSPEFIALEVNPTLTKIKPISTGSFTQNVTINDVQTTITVNIVNGQPVVPDSASVPDGYVQVYTFSPDDPYPGLIRWEGPNGEILFSERPANQPYAATPTEDAINQGIIQILEALIYHVNNNTLDLAVLLYLLDLTFNTVKSQAEQNVLGNNINFPNQQHGGGPNNSLQNILGILGQLIGMAQSMHLMDSVLDKGGMQNLLQQRSKDMAMLKMKKKLAQQAVQQKNEMQNMNPNQLMQFGNMAKNFGGKGKSNGGSKNQPNYNPNGTTGGKGTGTNSGAKVNSIINYTTTIGANKINVTSINGRAVIALKDVPNGYHPVDVNSDPNFIKWMLLSNSNVASQQVPFYTLKTTEAIQKAAQYLPANVISTLTPVTGEVLTTNIGGAYSVGFYPII